MFDFKTGGCFFGCLATYFFLKSAISRQAKVSKLSLVFWLNEIVAERFALQTIQQYLPNIQSNKRKTERLKGFSGKNLRNAREDTVDYSPPNF